MNSRALFWPAPAVDVMSNESDMSGQSHIAGRLPALFTNNLEINYANIIDNSPNPLKQGISRNHMQGKNLAAKAKLSTREPIETPRCQTSKPLVTP